jgi:hypothetical protein
MSDLLSFSYTIDPTALTKIKQFAGWQLVLEDELLKAHKKGTESLQNAARANMHWKNPTHKLEGSLKPKVENPYASWMGTDLPYAKRRNYGFSGKSDSLGRYFAHDPGQFYMDNAVKQKKSEIGSIFGEALDAALARLSAGS